MSRRTGIFCVAVIAALACLGPSLPAPADDISSPAAQAEKILRAMPEYRLPPAADDTAPLLRLSPLKPQLIRLDAPAGSIAVDGDSAELRAVRYGEKSVVLWPHKTGTARVTVKDAAGRILLADNVVVAEPGQKYLRVATGCHDGKSCAATRVFFCPYLCYETRLSDAGLK